MSCRLSFEKTKEFVVVILEGGVCMDSDLFSVKVLCKAAEGKGGAVRFAKFPRLYPARMTSLGEGVGDRTSVAASLLT